MGRTKFSKVDAMAMEGSLRSIDYAHVVVRAKPPSLFFQCLAWVRFLLRRMNVPSQPWLCVVVCAQALVIDASEGLVDAPAYVLCVWLLLGLLFTSRGVLHVV